MARVGIITSKTRVSQKQPRGLHTFLNRDHPWADGLRFLGIPLQVGVMVNIATPQRLPGINRNGPTYGLVQSAFNGYQMAVSFPGSTNVVDFGAVGDHHLDIADGIFSGFFDFVFNDGIGTLMSQRDGSAEDFQLYISGGTQLMSPDGSTDQLIPSAGFSATPHIIGWSSTTGTGNLTGYADGGVENTGKTITAATHESIQLSIGARWNGHPTTAFDYDGDVFAAGIWDGRKMDDESMEKITAGFWTEMLYTVGQRKFFVEVPAAGAQTVGRGLVNNGLRTHRPNLVA